MHIHSSLIQTAELYARPILGIRESDVVFSAAKLFFAYGLGNALTFPLAVGATAVLMAERPTPAAVFKRLKEHRPTIFYGVPTLYRRHARQPRSAAASDEIALRVCTSAGEALPADLGRRWTAHFGVEILDGIGSTEMLHIFLSNRPGRSALRHHRQAGAGLSTIRLVDDRTGDVATPASIGELQISGPSSATHYWNNRAKSLDTFVGRVDARGRQVHDDADGYYTLRRALRRHAQGERHVRLAVRGRSGADDPSRRAGGRGDRRGRRRRTWSSPRPSS